MRGTVPLAGAPDGSGMPVDVGEAEDPEET
jgi:hypothetical protein